MKIRKFQASTMREALAQIKRELSPDAIVVTTRQIRRGLLGTGVEVTAAVDTDDELVAPPPAAPGAALAEHDVERIMAPIRSELRSLRTLIRSTGESRHGDDLRAEIAALRQTLAGLGGATGPHDDPPLPQMAAGRTIASPSSGRCVALVGPSGVGKTTTIAKLAGRDALVDQLDVALVSMDTYRIGGEDQMRIFADLIGVPLHLVSDPAQLEDVLELCEDCDRVYIDTAGRSPRDPSAVRMLEEALRPVKDVEVHLAISSNMHPTVVDNAFRRYEDVGVDRLLVTKLDESLDLSELVRAPLRLNRQISYITAGQRIPEDVERATDDRLLALATGHATLAEAVA